MKKILTSLTACCVLTATICAKDKRPNIVFVLTDDQPVGYLSYEGNKVIQTPNIDTLAKEGTYFSNAHVASSAICTPSRISILLGQHERKHGVNFNSGTSVSPEAWAQSYPVLMRDAGYVTGYIGKNHSPIGEGGYKSGLMEKSFDYWYAGHGHISFYSKEKHRIFKHAQADTQLEIIQEGVSDFLSNEERLEGAITFLEKRPSDRPFCLSICLNLPHDSSSSTMGNRASDDPIYKDFLKDVEMPLPEHYLSKDQITTPKIPESVHHVRDRQHIYDYTDKPETLKPRYRRHMQAMVGIDRFIGQIREKLRNQEIDQNTIFVFTSDHGLFLGQFGLGGKSLCYEINTRVPFIIYDPRIEKSKRVHKSDALIQHCDIAPTLLSKAGIEISKEMQGFPLDGLLDGTKDNIRDYLFSENLWVNNFGNPHCEAIQDKEWKYIRYYQNNTPSSRYRLKIGKALGIKRGTMIYEVRDTDIPVYFSMRDTALKGEQPVYEELYHVGADPFETKNLINNTEYKTHLDRLRSAFLPLLKQIRGKGLPKVLRYTLESNNGIK